jgi:hypothetical protein
MKQTLLFLACIACVSGLVAQNRITGSLQSNGNFFISDPKIGASGTPQYDYQKFGAESWLNLNYSNWGFDMGVRFDMFNNSNLLKPTGSYSAQGIGNWFVRKKIDKFDLSGGYIYDQIGSGMIYRAYEERSLMIDNALIGVRIGYQINPNWKVRAFTGRQKHQFDAYGSVVRGGAIDGFIKPDSSKNFSLAPGFGVVARTYDDATINQVVTAIASYAKPDSTGAQYNTYAFSFYNTLTAGKFTWFIEGAGKTKDIVNDPLAVTARGDLGKLSDRSGYSFYTSLSYATKGLGITLEGKRTKDFAFRNTPFPDGVQGAMNFLPPMAKQNTYRLTTRFSPATQELGEQAFQLDAKYAVSKHISVGLNVSEIQDLHGLELYHEVTPEITFKNPKKWQVIAGVQLLHYNRYIYQAKNDPVDSKDPLKAFGGGKLGYVDALTPFTEVLYKFSARKSLRIEAQYLLTDDEFGSWVNFLAEFGWAPHWLIYASDMYKLHHSGSEVVTLDDSKYDGLHYPSVGLVYSLKASRLSLAFVKQVEGINCAGGICRLEPTFSGVRLNFNTSF